MRLEVAWLASVEADVVGSAGYFPRLTTFGGRSQGGVLARAVSAGFGGQTDGRHVCFPRKIGPGTSPLGSGVSKCRRGERRVTFFTLVFQLGVALILIR